MGHESIVLYIGIKSLLVLSGMSAKKMLMKKTEKFILHPLQEGAIGVSRYRSGSMRELV
jgi:hypothetical protein